MGHYHYCDFLKEWCSYAVPLFTEAKLIGYLVLFTPEEVIGQELIALSNLLGYKIITEIKNKYKEIQYKVQKDFKLTSKQKIVLRLLAEGQTEKAAAIEMGLNIGTIKYHKLNAFKKLNANCTIEAVIKAIKTNQISLEDINV